MSIKRTREVSRRRSSGDDSSYSSKPERVYDWDADVAAQAADAFVAYAPSYSYAKNDLLLHSVFGKGVVTRVEGTKVEVLFQAGPKKLAQSPTGTKAPQATPSEQPAATPPTTQQTE